MPRWGTITRSIDRHYKDILRFNESHSPRPRGATLLECVVALGVLALAFTLGAQALGWSAAQRRLGDQRQVALQEAANCLERVRQLKWEELTDERLAAIELSDEARQLLTSAELHVRPETTRGDPRGMRIEVEITWLTRHAETPLRVKLVTWRFPTQVTP